jgi:hypothetical protein
LVERDKSDAPQHLSPPLVELHEGQSLSQ